MGDKSLMKKTTLLMLSAATLLSANLSVKQIENMVLKIHKKRPGADIAVLEKTYNPFPIKQILEENNQTKETKVVVRKTNEVKLQLHAIMGNKAFINNKWLEVNDTIEGYELKYIGKRGVVLQSGNSIKKLLFNDKKNSLIKLDNKKSITTTCPNYERILKNGIVFETKKIDVSELNKEVINEILMALESIL
jgi:hypothetical protein